MIRYDNKETLEEAIRVMHDLLSEEELKDVNVYIIINKSKVTFDEAYKAMIEEEKALRFIKRNTKGDASETGLIRFVTPILMKAYGGPIEVKNTENSLDEIR